MQIFIVQISSYGSVYLAVHVLFHLQPMLQIVRAKAFYDSSRDESLGDFLSYTLGESFLLLIQPFEEPKE